VRPSGVPRGEEVPGKKMPAGFEPASAEINRFLRLFKQSFPATTCFSVLNRVCDCLALAESTLVTTQSAQLNTRKVPFRHVARGRSTAMRASITKCYSFYSKKRLSSCWSKTRLRSEAPNSNRMPGIDAKPKCSKQLCHGCHGRYRCGQSEPWASIC